MQSCICAFTVSMDGAPGSRGDYHFVGCLYRHRYQQAATVSPSPILCMEAGDLSGYQWHTGSWLTGTSLLSGIDIVAVSAVSVAHWRLSGILAKTSTFTVIKDGAFGPHTRYDFGLSEFHTVLSEFPDRAFQSDCKAQSHR